MTNVDLIKDLLASSKTIAVVGLSPKTHRASYDVAAYLKRQGYRIVPVNPSHAGKEILGEQCYANLTEAAQAMQQQGRQIDIVDCFRKSEDIPPVAEEAIAIAAKCLWMQLGIENAEAADKLRAAGLMVVEDQCIKIDHNRYL